MVAIYKVNPGDEIVDDDVNQYADWFAGTPGVEQSANLIQWDSPTVPTLTLKNANATSGAQALQVLDKDDDEVFSITRLASANDASLLYETLQLKNGAKFSMRSDNTAPISSHPFDIYQVDADQGTVLMEVIYDNEWVGTPAQADMAAAAIIGRQLTGDGYMRTMELDMIHGSAALTQPHTGIELSIQSQLCAGNGADMTVGMAIHNLGDLWFGATPAPKAIDTGLLIGRDNRPMTNFIRIMGNTEDANAATVLFNITRAGVMQTGNHLPLTDSTFTLGDVSHNWFSSWVDTYVSTAGIGTTIHFSLGATNTGLFLPASNSIGFLNNNTEAMRIDANGFINWKLAAQLPALGGGAAPTLGTIGGSGPSAAAQNCWLKMANTAGTPIFVPVWV